MNEIVAYLRVPSQLQYAMTGKMSKMNKNTIMKKNEEEEEVKEETKNDKKERGEKKCSQIQVLKYVTVLKKKKSTPHSLSPA